MINYLKSSYSHLSKTKYLFVLYAILRFVGLLKFALVANIFGKSLVSDSYFYTMFIVQIILAIADSGGPLYVAGISLLNTYKEKGKIDFSKSLFFILTFYTLIFFLCGLLIFLSINLIPQMLMPLMNTESSLFIETSSLIIKEIKIILPAILAMGIFAFFVTVSHYYGYYIFDIIFHLLLTIIEISFIAFLSKTYGIYSAFWGFNIGFLISIIISIIFIIPLLKDKMMIKSFLPYKDITIKFNYFIKDLIPNLGIFTTYFIQMFFFNCACSYFPAGSRTSLELAYKVSTYPNIILKKVVYTPMYIKLFNILKNDGLKSLQVQSFQYIKNINFILIPIAISMIYFSSFLMNIVYLNNGIDLSESALILSILSIALCYSSFEFVYRNIVYILKGFNLSLIIDLLSTLLGMSITLLTIKPLGIIALPIGLNIIALLKAISYTLACSVKYKIKIDIKIFYSYAVLLIVSSISIGLIKMLLQPN